MAIALFCNIGFTVVSRIVTFPDGFFLGKTFPGKTIPGWSLFRKDVSRIVIFPDGHILGLDVVGILSVMP